MPPVNPCVKCYFIGFNIFFMIVGALIIIISLALLSPSSPDGLHGGNDFEVQTTSHVFLYIVGSVTMAIAMLGAYGAHKENLVALTVFLVCMVVGSLLTLQAGVPKAAARPQLESLTEERWRSFLPLDQASDDIKNQAEALQSSLRCCGLFGHEDWEENIPDSCLCHQEEEGKCHAVSYRNFLSNLFQKKRSVFRQNCFPLVMDRVRTKANVELGVDFTLLALALLGLVLSSVTISQMFNTSNGPNAPLSAPVTFIDQPPAYQQLYNLTEYLDVREAKTP